MLSNDAKVVHLNEKKKLITQNIKQKQRYQIEIDDDDADDATHQQYYCCRCEARDAHRHRANCVDLCATTFTSVT